MAGINPALTNTEPKPSRDPARKDISRLRQPHGAASRHRSDAAWRLDVLVRRCARQIYRRHLFTRTTAVAARLRLVCPACASDLATPPRFPATGASVATVPPRHSLDAGSRRILPRRALPAARRRYHLLSRLSDL